MTVIGFIVALIGVLGMVTVFVGLHPLPAPLDTVGAWGVVTLVGAAVFVLTRRPRD